MPVRQWPTMKIGGSVISVRAIRRPQINACRPRSTELTPDTPATSPAMATRLGETAKRLRASSRIQPEKFIPYQKRKYQKRSL